MANSRQNQNGRPLFALGQVVATPGALDLLDRARVSSFDLLIRHHCGDWGSVPPEDSDANTVAVKMGNRIISSYYLNEHERLWIITEADRSATTLLLPDEY